MPKALIDLPTGMLEPATTHSLSCLREQVETKTNRVELSGYDEKYAKVLATLSCR